MIQHAVQLAAGDQSLQRDGISIYTAFHLDVNFLRHLVITCRALRDNVIVVIPHCTTQQRKQGGVIEFLFTIRLNRQSMVMTPANGLPRKSYFEADRHSQDGREATLRWRDEKINFANTLLSLSPRV